MSNLTKNITVTDEYGTPLESVNILIAPGVGTTTNKVGRASVTSPSRNQNIVLSHIGHTSEQYVFSNLPEHVTLISEIESLDEVVIIAQKPPPIQTPEPVKKAQTPWYIWAGLLMSAIGVFATVNTTQSQESVGLSKAKKPLSRKRKKPVKNSTKKTSKKKSTKKTISVTI